MHVLFSSVFGILFGFLGWVFADCGHSFLAFFCLLAAFYFATEVSLWIT